MSRQSIVLLALLLTTASSILAGKHPNLEKGFSADKSYQVGELDSVNTYNGNLNVSIPLGQRFKGRGQIAYQFVLTYNSKLWDHETAVHFSDRGRGNESCVQESNGNEYARSIPSRRANAGFGWLLSLGRLIPPNDPANDPSEPIPGTPGGYQSYRGWVYESPDGADHDFYSSMKGEDRTTCTPQDSDPTLPPPTILFTRDGSYYRLNIGNPNRVVTLETGEGLTHTFSPFELKSDESRIEYKLTSITDRFNNFLKIEYSTDGLRWTIRDGYKNGSSEVVVRTHTVDFQPAPSGSGLGYDIYHRLRVHKVTLASGDVYELSYKENVTLVRGPGGDPPQDCDVRPVVPILTGVKLPDGTSYLLQSSDTFDGNLPSGELLRLTYPTGGSIAWTYGPYTVGALPCVTDTTPGQRFFQLSNGIKSRTVSDGLGRARRWDYLSSPIRRRIMERCVSPPGRSANLFYADHATVSVTGPYDPSLQAGGEVKRVLHYFSIWPEKGGLDDTVQSMGFSSYELGLPFTRVHRPAANPEIACDDEKGCLSTETSVCQAALINDEVKFICGAAKRSMYVKYELDVDKPCTGNTLPSSQFDSNRRLSFSRTVYHDDANREVITSYSGFDGFGHYRTVEKKNGTPFTLSQSMTTNYNPGIDTGTYKVTSSIVGNERLWNAAGSDFPQHVTTRPWLIGLYDSQRTSQTDGSGTTAAETRFCFDADGFLNKKRTLKATGSAGAMVPGRNDLLVTYFRNPQGDVASEAHAGGDGDCPSSPCHSLTDALETCSVTKSTTASARDSYTINHTYEHSGLKTSQYEGSNFLSLDRTEVRATGATSEIRDPAQVGTRFNYGVMGRLNSGEPILTGGPLRSRSTRIAYQPAVRASQNPGALLSSGPALTITSQGTDLLTTIMQFDGLGRPRREETTPATGTPLTKRTTEYSTNGMVAFSSVPVPANVNPLKGTTQKHDIFNRPLEVLQPDAAKTTYAYVGDRLVTRTIHTGAAAGHQVSTEEYDILGRLVKVSEHSNPDGTSVDTSYGYDVGGRLASVATSDSSQARSFSYDGRGFLQSETHPESGRTEYGRYDARGHARQRTAAGRPGLEFEFDSAERLVRVRSNTAGTLKTLEEYTFGTGIGNGDWSRGKLKTATRFNYLAQYGVRDTAVTEEYVYGGVDGQASSRVTTVSDVSPAGVPTTTVARFEESFEYDDLGATSKIIYPRNCSVSGCDTSGTVVGSRREVSNTYSRGWLTGVSTGVDPAVPTSLGELTYHVEGNPATLSHDYGGGRKLLDTWGPDPNGIPRPSEIDLAMCGVEINVSESGAPLQLSDGNLRKKVTVAEPRVLLTATSPTPGATFQWYRGPSGSISNPLPSQSSTLDFTATGLHEFWVRVSNGNCASDSRTVIVSVAVSFRGDADGDGRVTVADVFYLVSYLFTGGPAPNPTSNGDVNGDCMVTVADTFYLINFLFSGGPSPVVGCTPAATKAALTPTSLASRVPRPSPAAFDSSLAFRVPRASSAAFDSSSPAPLPAAAGNATLPPWSSGTFAYDAAGNITTMGLDAFQYDRVGRLVEARLAKGGAVTETFVYDRFGNRTRRTATNGTGQTITVDPGTNRIGSILNEAGGVTNWMYDAIGNVTSVVVPSVVTYSYDWDPLDAMAKQTVGSSSFSYYLYSAGGERIAVCKPAADGTENWTWSLRGLDNKVLRQFTSTRPTTAGAPHRGWAVKEDYIYRGSALLASQGTDGELVRYHLDHLGTPRVITRPNLGRLSTHNYYPFGAETESSTPGSKVMKFTGHERDLTGEAYALDYMHARYYDAGVGRFLSVDPANSGQPIRPQSWNRYAYVSNNPLRAVDPDGMREALVYGQTLNVEPGYVVVLVSKTDANDAEHVAVVGGFDDSGVGPPRALILENAPISGVMSDGAFVDTSPHTPTLTDSNSPTAGSGIWNGQTLNVGGVQKNTKMDGSHFTQGEVISKAGKVGSVTYDGTQAGTKGPRCDCAGYVNQVIDQLGGTAKSTVTTRTFFDRLLGRPGTTRVRTAGDWLDGTRR